MRATLTEGAVCELELSASTGEWLAFAEALESGAGEVECGTQEAAARGEVRLGRIAIRPGPRAKLLIGATPAEATVSGTPALLARFARLIREFASKSRRGQTDPVANRGPEHFIDPASILTLLHLGGEAAHRNGDVGG